MRRWSYTRSCQWTCHELGREPQLGELVVGAGGRHGAGGRAVREEDVAVGAEVDLDVDAAHAVLGAEGDRVLA